MEEVVKQRILGLKTIVFDLDGVLVDSLEDIALCVNKTLEYYEFSPLDTGTIRGFIGDGSLMLIQRALTASVKREHLALSIPQGLIESMNLWFKHYYGEHPVCKSKLYPRVGELLVKLACKDIYLSVVSNKPSVVCKAILDSLGIYSIFSCVIGGDEVQELKPSEQGIRLALATINAKVEGLPLPKIGGLLSEDAKLSLMLECLEEDGESSSSTKAELARDSKALAIGEGYLSYGKLSPATTLMVGDSYEDIEAAHNASCMSAAITKGYGDKTKLLEAMPQIVLDYAYMLEDILGL